MKAAFALLVSFAIAAPAHAQAAADSAHDANGSGRPQIAAFGVSAGTMHFGDGGYERAVSAAVTASLSHGFSLSVNPTYAWAQAAPSLDALTSQLVTPPPVHGIADLPVSLGWSHAFPGAWSPAIGVALGATFPIGDTATVGSGQTAFGANLGLGVEPVPGWSIGAVTGHTLSNGYASGLGSIAPTTVSADASHRMGTVGVNIGYSTEMGPVPAGTTHSQNVAGGAAIPLGGATSLTVSASTGKADGVRSWAMAVGMGTTFADVARVTPFAAVNQLASALGKGRTMSSTRSTAAKAAALARKSVHKKMA